MSNDKYILEMNECQAKLLGAALEFYARMQLGQWHILSEHTLRVSDPDEHYHRREALDQALLEARKIAFPELHGRGHSHGIGTFQNADIAWELYQVVRHAIAWHENPEGAFTTDFDKPISFVGRELAKCSVVETNHLEKSDG